ncbi:DUF3616 domain-containing protein [Vogesella sp. XCS3]|uniref:DUF3616 domain-containing protein n=1 Tax=Vogesella sp. XCS3 TaxID=2877939 RepID=UPI001D0BC735|nr:DUF3616 domain-containing protein [Vogesella sp. XCS3]UDM17832.1 DUF3616 domain-containing protein [Vogesella sp. XCS3]
MPKKLSVNAVSLALDSAQLVHDNLSGAVAIGDTLWVAGDEACGLDRLLRDRTAQGLHFVADRHYPLSDYLPLPDSADIEADLEGLAVADGYLWLVGSHGLKRKAPQPARDAAANLKRLATVTHDGNRCLLARIPLLDEGDGVFSLQKNTADGRTAATLKGKKKYNELTALLAEDPQLAPFMAIPGKDNGFDIEGLAAVDGKLLLGLRGPVLRGWSCLLEVRLEARKGELRLAPLDDSGLLYRKHFLPLAGLGVRDLHLDGDDLLLLAGPTMVLDGAVRVYRWLGARAALAGVAAGEGAALWWEGVAEHMVLPHGKGTDRAEALCRLPPHWAGQDAWLVLYDAPSAKRKPQAGLVYGDLMTR